MSNTNCIYYYNLNKLNNSPDNISFNDIINEYKTNNNFNIDPKPNCKIVILQDIEGTNKNNIYSYKNYLCEYIFYISKDEIKYSASDDFILIKDINFIKDEKIKELYNLLYNKVKSYNKKKLLFLHLFKNNNKKRATSADKLNDNKGTTSANKKRTTSADKLDDNKGTTSANKLDNYLIDKHSQLNNKIKDYKTLFKTIKNNLLEIQKYNNNILDDINNKLNNYNNNNLYHSNELKDEIINLQEKIEKLNEKIKKLKLEKNK